MTILNLDDLSHVSGGISLALLPRTTNPTFRPNGLGLLEPAEGAGPSPWAARPADHDGITFNQVIAATNAAANLIGAFDRAFSSSGAPMRGSPQATGSVFGATPFAGQSPAFTGTSAGGALPQGGSWGAPAGPAPYGPPAPGGYGAVGANPYAAPTMGGYATPTSSEYGPPAPSGTSASPDAYAMPASYGEGGTFASSEVGGFEAYGADAYAQPDAYAFDTASVDGGGLGGFDTGTFDAGGFDSGAFG